MDNLRHLPSIAPMVALNTRYLADLTGPGRLAFIATNGLHDCAVVEDGEEDEFRQRLREGWRMVAIRPICRSINPLLDHQHPDLQKARAYSYSLIILENPAHQKIAAHSDAMRAGNVLPLPPAR